MRCVQVFVNRVYDAIPDQCLRIIFQMSLANLCILNRHELGQYAQRNTALTQIGNQLILGCGNIRIWHIIAAAVREAVFTLEPQGIVINHR